MSSHEALSAQYVNFLMSRLGVELVVDVGANTGQFARTLRAYGYAGTIVSIEPLSAAFAELKERCANDGNWTCYQCAVGGTDGTATINVSANSFSSSLLPVRERTLQLEPRVAYIAQETVALRRLDSLLPPAAGTKRIFLKIDTQGYEQSVIAGASGILDGVVMIQMELAWTPSYEGQAEMGTMVSALRELGFEPAWVASAWTDPATLLMPEVDVTFIRRSIGGSAIQWYR
jgi:FkbM family methyltransferase